MTDSEANDIAIDLIPDDPYQPCPCGCGKKWRFVTKEGEQTIQEHWDRLIAKIKEEHT